MNQMIFQVHPQLPTFAAQPLPSVAIEGCWEAVNVWVTQSFWKRKLSGVIFIQLL
jgi:hypothetical protein